jgi:hypothetical protein
VTLSRLRGEIAAIERAFPKLADLVRRRQVVRRAAKQTSTRTRTMCQPLRERRCRIG